MKMDYFHPVFNPEHYNYGNIEFIDWLKQGVSTEEFRGFLKGNIFKYLFRYQHKGGADDLNKAKAYIQMLEDFEASAREDLNG
jgi:hypothetical protein